MLNIEHLTLTHQKDLTDLIRDFSFSVQPGERIALIGEEGNGKSTLLRAIAGDPSIQNYIEISGKNCVVIGRSNIVGKPMSMLLLHRHGTVTICHSRTKDLKEICANADILVAAVGKAGFVTADMVKEGAAVIDVGINRNAEGKVCGDVCTAEAAEKAAYITPVPGGVGPMTITMLMKNTLKAARLQNGLK